MRCTLCPLLRACVPRSPPVDRLSPSYVRRAWAVHTTLTCDDGFTTAPQLSVDYMRRSGGATGFPTGIIHLAVTTYGHTRWGLAEAVPVPVPVPVSMQGSPRVVRVRSLESDPQPVDKASERRAVVKVYAFLRKPPSDFGNSVHRSEKKS